MQDAEGTPRLNDPAMSGLPPSKKKKSTKKPCVNCTKRKKVKAADPPLKMPSQTNGTSADVQKAKLLLDCLHFVVQDKRRLKAFCKAKGYTPEFIYTLTQK